MTTSIVPPHFQTNTLGFDGLIGASHSTGDVQHGPPPYLAYCTQFGGPARGADMEASFGHVSYRAVIHLEPQRTRKAENHHVFA